MDYLSEMCFDDVRCFFPLLGAGLFGAALRSCDGRSALLPQRCWLEDGATPCVLVETPHKELEPADPSSFKQYRFTNLFIQASPLPRLR